MKRAALITSLGVLALLVFAVGAISQSGGDSVRVATSGDDSEIVKTLPIGKKNGDKKRSVMSISSARVGDLQSGDILRTSAEVEVTVCLKKNQLHSGPGKDCTGRVYGYNPHISAQVVLAQQKKDTGGGSTLAVSPEKKITCSQEQPDRNHHCVLVVKWTDSVVPSSLPCSECRLNLVMSAWHRNAKGGEVVVVGADSNGPIVQDKGRVNAVRFRGGEPPVQPEVVKARRSKRIQIINDGNGSLKETVVYSARIPNPRAGEQIVAEGLAVGKISQHPYSVFMPSEMVLTSKRGGTKQDLAANKVTDFDAQLAENNGLNCTQGNSAHDNPCKLLRVGVADFVRSKPKTLYLNLVVAAEAKLTDERWSSRDDVAVLKKGYLKVWRYGPEYGPPIIED